MLIENLKQLSVAKQQISTANNITLPIDTISDLETKGMD